MIMCVPFVLMHLGVSLECKKIVYKIISLVVNQASPIFPKAKSILDSSTINLFMELQMSYLNSSSFHLHS
jgi:hypothetical protein